MIEMNSPPEHRASRKGGPTWELAYMYPNQGEWTEAEYLALPADGRMIELSDGCLEFLPMPTMFHQALLDYLFSLLKAFVVARALGRVFFAPLPVGLGSGTYREPDVVFLRHERIRDMHRQPQGADLAMEVLSPGEENRERDLVTKRREYAQARIAEYWIVDPQEQRITVLTLDGQTYRVHGEFTLGQQATSVLLAGFSVAVDAVFAAGQGSSS